jgi:hypothetical protein
VAVSVGSGGEIHRPGGDSSREKERGGRGLPGIYRRGRKAAVWGSEVVAGEAEPGVRDDRWVPPVIGEREGEAYPFGFHLGGPWAASWSGPEWLPRSFSFLFYFLLFLFLFSELFYFFFILIQK